MKWFLMIFTFSLCAFAQDAAPVAVQVAATDQIISKLQAVNAAIPISLPAAAVSVIVALATVLVRVYPTASSWCVIFTPLAAIFGLLSFICDKLKQLSEFLASSLNNVVPPKA